MLGKTLIMTDGKTLLGADDKAGIAEIITAMVRLKTVIFRTVISALPSRRMKKSAVVHSMWI